MVILGIDPGTATTGFGVVELDAGRLVHRKHGTIRTPADESLPTRLKTIHDALHQLVVAYKPAVVAVEQVFFGKNAVSAFSVGHARGVVLLAAAQSGAEVAEYTPIQVKASVCGQGRAPKSQVAFMVRALLGLDALPTPVDAADALAVAICHAHGTAAMVQRAFTRGGDAW